jgi:uncharacterized protein YebE (UPF0316 family)
MQVIVCKLNMFSLNQVVQVFDTNENKIIYTEAVNGEELIPLICALAKKLEINEVRLDGIYDYTIFEGQGSKEKMTMIFIVLPRKEAPRVLKDIRKLCDNKVFVVASEISKYAGGHGMVK